MFLPKGVSTAGWGKRIIAATTMLGVSNIHIRIHTPYARKECLMTNISDNLAPTMYPSSLKCI